MILSILTSMGLGVIDENMTGLLEYMHAHEPDLAAQYFKSIARSVGVCIAMGVGANECYQMMLGRRGLDVMKILHILIISLCITFSDTIAAIAEAPGMALERRQKDAMLAINDNLKTDEDNVAQLQEEYINAIRVRMQQLQQEIEAEREAQSSGWIDDIKNSIADGVDAMIDKAKDLALTAETKICEWISIILRWIFEIIFQAMIYAVLASQRIFSAILKCFAPVMFAMSLAPHYKNAWSQWLSKYISLSLWGFIAYTIVIYVFFILQYNLDQDAKAYETLIGGVDNMTDKNANIFAIGMNSLGTTCMYIVGCLIGIKCLASVSEVASWCIPGGVASSSTGAMTGAVAAGAAAAGSAAGGAAVSGAGAVGAQAQKNLSWSQYYGQNNP